MRLETSRSESLAGGFGRDVDCYARIDQPRPARLREIAAPKAAAADEAGFDRLRDPGVMRMKIHSALLRRSPIRSSRLPNEYIGFDMLHTAYLSH